MLLPLALVYTEGHFTNGPKTLDFTALYMYLEIFDVNRVDVFDGFGDFRHRISDRIVKTVFGRCDYFDYFYL